MIIEAIGIWWKHLGWKSNNDQCTVYACPKGIERGREQNFDWGSVEGDRSRFCRREYLTVIILQTWFINLSPKRWYQLLHIALNFICFCYMNDSFEYHEHLEEDDWLSLFQRSTMVEYPSHGALTSQEEMYA